MKQFRQRSGVDALGSEMVASGSLVAFGLCVALVVAVLMIASSWTVRLVTAISPRLAGDATVAVWGRGLESADAATARAVEILSTLPGTRAVEIEPDLSDTWVGALIGRRKVAGDSPRLISLAAKSPDASINGSIEHLRAVGIAAEADDHHGVNGPLERRAIFVGSFVTGVTVLLCGLLFFASVAAGRRCVVRHHRHIALMIRLGARRGFLARLIQWRVGLAVATGALVGLLIGEVGAPLAIRLETTRVLPAFGPALVDGVVALPWPLILFLVAVSGAGVGAGGALKRAERIH